MFRHKNLALFHPLLALLGAVALLVGLTWGPAATAAPNAAPGSGAVLEEQRVTAVDTLLHFDRDGFSEWATGNATPENLGAADFEVWLDGVARPVVAVEALEHLDASHRSPWTQLIYIDCNMLETGQLRSAIGLLHRELGRLLALGKVEVIVADPAPRQLLAATDNAAALEALLARLALDTECRDTPQALRDELVRLRQPQPPAPGGAEAAPSPAELAAAARDAEAEAVRISTLGLVQTLSDGERSVGTQKVVYLLHNGFDRRAAEFYAQKGAAAEPDADAKPAIGPILLAQLIASYGWTVMPVSEKAFEASLSGAEIGRFLVQLQNGEQIYQGKNPPVASPPASPLDAAQRTQSLLGAFTASLREKRDSKRAESYLELGEALAGQKKWPEAEDAFRKAIYHFDGVKKHQAKEAKAWLGVGRAKAGQGELASGRAATERAIELDPSLVRRGEA